MKKSKEKKEHILLTPKIKFFGEENSSTFFYSESEKLISLNIVWYCKFNYNTVPENELFFKLEYYNYDDSLKKFQLLPVIILDNEQCSVDDNQKINCTEFKLDDQSDTFYAIKYSFLTSFQDTKIRKLKIYVYQKNNYIDINYDTGFVIDKNNFELYNLPQPILMCYNKKDENKICNVSSINDNHIIKWYIPIDENVMVYYDIFSFFIDIKKVDSANKKNPTILWDQKIIVDRSNKNLYGVIKQYNNQKIYEYSYIFYYNNLQKGNIFNVSVETLMINKKSEPSESENYVIIDGSSYLNKKLHTPIIICDTNETIHNNIPTNYEKSTSHTFPYCNMFAINSTETYKLKFNLSYEYNHDFLTDILSNPLIYSFDICKSKNKEKETCIGELNLDSNYLECEIIPLTKLFNFEYKYIEQNLETGDVIKFNIKDYVKNYNFSSDKSEEKSFIFINPTDILEDNIPNAYFNFNGYKNNLECNIEQTEYNDCGIICYKEINIKHGSIYSYMIKYYILYEENKPKLPPYIFSFNFLDEEKNVMINIPSYINLRENSTEKFMQIKEYTNSKGDIIGYYYYYTYNTTQNLSDKKYKFCIVPIIDFTLEKNKYNIVGNESEYFNAVIINSKEYELPVTMDGSYYFNGMDGPYYTNLYVGSLSNKTYDDYITLIEQDTKEEYKYKINIDKKGTLRLDNLPIGIYNIYGLDKINVCTSFSIKNLINYHRNLPPNGNSGNISQTFVLLTTQKKYKGTCKYSYNDVKDDSINCSDFISNNIASLYFYIDCSFIYKDYEQSIFKSLKYSMTGTVISYEFSKTIKFGMVHNTSSNSELTYQYITPELTHVCIAPTGNKYVFYAPVYNIFMNNCKNFHRVWIRVQYEAGKHYIAALSAEYFDSFYSESNSIKILS